MPVLDKIVERLNGGYVRGWYDVGPMKLYVSPGTSLWNGFHLRLLDPAEITLLTLHGAGEQTAFPILSGRLKFQPQSHSHSGGKTL